MGVYHEQGKYQAKIIAAALTVSKNGNDQLLLTLEPSAILAEDGQWYAAKQSRFPPEIYLTLTAKTLGTPQEPGWAARTLAHIGFKGNFERLEQDVVGWEGDVYCQHGQDQDGNPREEWSIERQSGPRAVAADPKQARKLNATFGKIFGSTHQRPATPPPPAKAPPPKKPASTPTPSNGRPHPQPAPVSDEEFSQDDPYAGQDDTIPY